MYIEISKNVAEYTKETNKNLNFREIDMARYKTGQKDNLQNPT